MSLTRFLLRKKYKYHITILKMPQITFPHLKFDWIYESAFQKWTQNVTYVCSLEALSFLIKLVHWTLNFGPEMASELLVLSQIMFMGPPPQIRFFCVHRENVHSQQWTWKTAFECQTLHNSEAQTYNEEEQEERGVCDWRWTLNKYQDIWSWSWVFWCLRS